MANSRPQIVRLNEVPAVDCPCGLARRAFADQSTFPGTVHLTEIHRDAKAHFHEQHTEIYVILTCKPDAQIELEGVNYPVTPMTAILIPPGVKHRAIGEMQVLIICNPAFDPTDEKF